jgi:hypothetical protein
VDILLSFSFSVVDEVVKNQLLVKRT